MRDYSEEQKSVTISKLDCDWVSLYDTRVHNQRQSVFDTEKI